MADNSDTLKQILEQLKAQGKQLKAQGKQLKAQGEQLKAQGEQLKAQGEQLKAQGQDLERMEKGQQKIASDLTKLTVHVEGEITDKIRGLYDARDLTLDSLARIEERLDHQDKRLDLHWQEIMVSKNKRR
jgi:uncharacterized protein (DUF3084 family)